MEKYLIEKYTAQTAKTYLYHITKFLSNFPQAPIAKYKELIAYLGEIRAAKCHSKTLLITLASIKVYYEYLYVSEQRSDNPSKSIRLRDKISRDIQLQDLFTTEELDKLIDKKERYPALTLRNKVLISLLIYQALKPEEIAQLSLENINLSIGTVYIKSTPKSHARTLHLKTHQILLFHEYQEKSRPELLKSLDSQHFIVTNRSGKMSAEDITKHIKRSYKSHYSPRIVNCQTIRQSVISNLLKAGNDLRIVQVFAGHKYISSTEKYKQSSMEELKIAINNYHPIQ